MITFRPALRALTIGLIVAVLSSLAHAETGDKLGSFIKYNKGSGTLQTAITSYQNSKGQTVDLIAAVHIGSKSYYKTLNSKFQGYDALLYELVLPDDMAGQQLPAHMESDSGVSGLQGMMARSMGLVTQVSHIDYSPSNFVHADLTTSGLQRKMAARQENMLGYLMNSLLQSSQIDEDALGLTEEEMSQLDLMAVLSGQAKAKDRKLMRKLFASILASSGGLMSAMNDTAIIAERNKKALKVLGQQSAAGKRNLGIFYGAAHMPDLEKRLQKAGWRKVKTSWVKAWSV